MFSIPKPEFVISSDDISSASFIDGFNVILLSSNDGKVSLFNSDTQRLIVDYKTGKKDLIFARGFFDDNSLKDEFPLLKLKILCHFKIGDIILYEIVENGSLNILLKWNATTVCFARCFLNSLHDSFGFISGESKESAFEIVDRKTFEITKLNFDSSSHGVITDSYYWKESDESLFVLFSDETGTLTLYEYKIGTWNFLTKKCHSELFKELILCFDFHNESKRGIAGSVGDEIVIWSIDLVKYELKINKRIKLNNSGTTCCSIRPDGKIFSIANKDGQIQILSFKSGKSLASIPFHSSSIKDMNFSEKPIKNGYQLIVADNHTLLSVWSLYKENDLLKK